jgi:hypothetical protein
MVAIKLTTPDDMVSHKIEEALRGFEAQFKNESMNQDYYFLVINLSLTRKQCDLVEEAYKKAGWKTVECKTSAENGERPGFTGLKLANYTS